MIQMHEGPKTSGKTKLAVSYAIHCLVNGRYDPTDQTVSYYRKLFTNINLHYPDDRIVKVTNERMRLILTNLNSPEFRQCMFLIDEIETLANKRLWGDNVNFLMNLWQTDKNGIYVIATSHFGGHDIMIRDATDITIVHKGINIKTDEMLIVVKVWSYGWPTMIKAIPFQSIGNDYYDRSETVL